MKFQDFAFTLRKTSIKRKPATEDDYKKHIERIFDRNDLKCYHYAFEQERGLHCHGSVELKGVYLTQQKRLRIRGWHLHLVPIFDAKGWSRYYLKNQKLLDQQYDTYDVQSTFEEEDYVVTEPDDDDEDITSHDEALFGEYIDQFIIRPGIPNLFMNLETEDQPELDINSA